jgi:hypothetical protein
MNDRKTAEEAKREHDTDVGHDEAHRHPYQHNDHDADDHGRDPALDADPDRDPELAHDPDPAHDRAQGQADWAEGRADHDHQGDPQAAGDTRHITTDPEGQGFAGDRPNDVDDRTNDVDDRTNPVGDPMHPVGDRPNDVDDHTNAVDDHPNAMGGRLNEVDDRPGELKDQTGDLHGQPDDVQGRTDDLHGRPDDLHGREDDLHGRPDDADDTGHRATDVSDRPQDVDDRYGDSERFTGQDTGVGPAYDDHRDELLVPSQRSADTQPVGQAGHTGQTEPGDVLIAAQPQSSPQAQHAVPYQSMELFDQDPTQLRERWRDVQTGFVDEPREAVERADQLVDEVVTTLTTALSTRTNELRERWKNAGESDTEQLRLALREYRQVLEQLMSLSSGERR